MAKEPVPRNRHGLNEIQLLSARSIAARLEVSQRTIQRMADRSEMPKPMKVGRLIRWDATAIERWIAAGCPAATQELNAKVPDQQDSKGSDSGDNLTWNSTQREERQ
ncbi:hypothetical protein CKO51_13255 [Rhodopirellula sp. SM50]|nr:hypothetical protein CKO51_13255 [Rhodopirellula sp. SM50]